MKVNDKPIVVEQCFNASMEKVWSAITDAVEMRKWFFDNIPQFKAEVGFKTRFIVKSEEREFLHIWTVTEVIPQKKIKTSWKYEGYAGNSYVTFELFKEKEGTKLKVSTEVLEDFQAGIPEFERESCVGGWQYFIQNRLNEYLIG